MALMAGFRTSCQPKFDIDDDLVDGINLGRFPDNRELKVCCELFYSKLIIDDDLQANPSNFCYEY